jgi:hypothetical protein
LGLALTKRMQQKYIAQVLEPSIQEPSQLLFSSFEMLSCELCLIKKKAYHEQSYDKKR